AVRAHSSELDRSKPPEGELRGETLAIGRSEIDRVQLARIERIPRRRARGHRQGVRTEGFHRLLSRGGGLSQGLSPSMSKALAIRPDSQPFLHAPPATGRFAPVT